MQNEFIAFLLRHRLFSAGKNRAVVVFDGFTENVVSGSPNMEVVFSRDISADEKIAQITRCRANVVVVSNDREVLANGRASGSKCMSVEEFLGSGKVSGKKRRIESKKDISRNIREEINRELEEIWLRKES